MMKAMGIIFSNIFDSSLSELTRERTVASLPFAARYRFIDFTLSNMTNSGIQQIGIITKYNYRSLMDHLGSCQEWDLNLKNNGVVFLPPYATGHSGVYRGKLEALYNSLDFLEKSDADYVVLSDSVTLCALDLSRVVEEHEDSGCDVTAVVTPYQSKYEKTFQICVRLGDDGKVIDMGVDVTARDCMAGMGMYVMRRETLIDAVRECAVRGRYHLERDYMQRDFNHGTLSIHGYVFRGTALFNISTLDYYHNSMALLNPEVFHGIFNQRGLTIYTKVRDAVPTYFGDRSKIDDCLVADGCRLMGRAERSVLFRDVTIADSAVVKDSVLMQGCIISEGAVVEGMILDKNVTIRPYTVLKGTTEHPLIIEKGANV
ncbi:MAG: glucose-1-phosphate adenylyltransferase subunit GlgD [Oscillospiraceae bacterium]|nr:glucose-1-phosphate adenylyltransferase subunit GlgD [Oscillospiraceae bacterium]